MLVPKKTIPKLAVAALALTGCGGDGNGGGAAGNSGTGGAAGSGGSAGSGGGSASIEASIEAFCMKLVECNYYVNTSVCVAYLTYYYGLDDELTAECESAAISYFDCGTLLTCAELGAMSNSCDDEFIAAAQACYYAS
jgi:hypothetical protein